MKASLGTLPVPLQRQVLIRAGLAAAAAAAGVGLLALTGSAAMAAPCFVAALLAAVSARHIYRLSILGRCLILRGTLLKTEVSALRRRPKALLLEVEGKALRVVLYGRRKALGAGAMVEVYFADDTPIYDWRGMHQLQSYLALVAESTKGLD